MVESKFIFKGADAAKVLAVFNLAEPSQVRTVGFFDTSDRQLFLGRIAGSDSRLILRARFTAGKKRGKTTLKIRTTGRLDDSLRTDEKIGAKREFDFAFGRELLDSYSLDDEQDRDEIQAVFAGERSVKKLFGAGQEVLINEVAGKGFSWTDLRVFGPLPNVQTWENLSVGRFELPLTLEFWMFPPSGDRPGGQIVELSFRAAPDEQEKAVQRLLGTLKQKQLHPQTTETKTQTVLMHFLPGKPLKT